MTDTTVRLFIESKCDVDTGRYTNLWRLHRVYTEYCEQMGFDPVGPDRFVNDARHMGIDYMVYTMNCQPNRFLGIELKQ